MPQRIDVNQASKEELAQVGGIGDQTAERIISIARRTDLPEPRGAG